MIKIILTLIERRQRQFIIIWCIVWKEMKVEWDQSKSMCWVWELKYIWEQEYHYVLLLLLTFRFMLFLASFLSSLIISTQLFSLYISLLQNVLYVTNVLDSISTSSNSIESVMTLSLVESCITRSHDYFVIYLFIYLVTFFLHPFAFTLFIIFTNWV